MQAHLTGAPQGQTILRTHFAITPDVNLSQAAIWRLAPPLWSYIILICQPPRQALPAPAAERVAALHRMHASERKVSCRQYVSMSFFESVGARYAS